MIASSKKSRHVEPAATDDDFLACLVAANYWDCLSFEPFTASQRLFGNANIGNLDLTNLQIPGQLPSDDAFVITNWYLRTNMPRPDREVAALLTRSYAALEIGNSRRWQSPLARLLDNQRPPLWPIVIEPRQNFEVRVDFFGYDEAVTRIMAWALSERATRPTFRPLVWIHLEGVLVPGSLYFDNGSGLSWDDPKVQLQWRRLRARVFRYLTTVEQRGLETSEHIARWLGQLSDDEAPDELRAQLSALADAVREGRWRPESAAPEPTP